jgi:hypothetical protein
MEFSLALARHLNNNEREREENLNRDQMFDMILLSLIARLGTHCGERGSLNPGVVGYCVSRNSTPFLCVRHMAGFGAVENGFLGMAF